MPKPYALNTGSTISGTTQIGNIAIGDTAMDYSANPGGVKWWMGPNEDDGYVLCAPDPLYSHTSPAGVNAGIRFKKYTGLTESSFLTLVNFFAREEGHIGNFTGVTDADAWLALSGFSASAPALEIVWDNIANVPGGDATVLSNWNTWFDLPENGTPFTNVRVSGNTVKLYGGGNMTLLGGLFGGYLYYQHVIEVNDYAGVIVRTLVYGFSNGDDNSIISRMHLPELRIIGDYTFRGPYSSGTLEIYIPKCISLGTSVAGDNNVFAFGGSKVINLTIPAHLMTCNGGYPDGDIQILQANNMVTIHEVPNNYSPELLTSWANVYFDSFVSSGSTIINASSTGSHWSGCISNSFDVAVGEIYHITTNFHFVSDATPLWYIGTGAVGSSMGTPNFNMIDGLHTYIFTITIPGTAYFTNEVFGDTGFSISYASIKKLV